MFKNNPNLVAHIISEQTEVTYWQVACVRQSHTCNDCLPKIEACDIATFEESHSHHLSPMKTLL